MKQRYFNIASKLAKKSTSKFRLGCVIVKKNSIVSFGWNNMTKTHPRCKTYGNYIHAELHAILNTNPEELKGSTAYVYRERKDGTKGMSRPCPVCSEALKFVGIKKVCYTTDTGFIQEVL